MEELDLKELLSVFWNKKVQIILLTAIFMVLGVIYTMGFVKPVYTSSTTLVLAKSENSGKTTGDDTITSSDIQLNSKLVSTYSELVKSKKVLRKVISNLGIQLEEDELRKNITVSSVKDTEFIEIKVTNADSSIAARIANETAKVFIENVTEMYNLSNVHIVDQAEIPDEPSNIHHTRDIIIFAFGGLVVSIIYVLVSNMLDTTVKSVEDVEKILDVPVLASIPYHEGEDKGGKRK